MRDLMIVVVILLLTGVATWGALALFVDIEREVVLNALPAEGQPPIVWLENDGPGSDDTEHLDPATYEAAPRVDTRLTGRVESLRAALEGVEGEQELGCIAICVDEDAENEGYERQLLIERRGEGRAARLGWSLSTNAGLSFEPLLACYPTGGAAVECAGNGLPRAATAFPLQAANEPEEGEDPWAPLPSLVVADLAPGQCTCSREPNLSGPISIGARIKKGEF